MSTHRRWIPILALTLAALPSSAHAQRRGAPVELPDGNGKAVVEGVCSACHGLDRVSGDGYTREGWLRLMGTMVELPAADAALVADYLAKNFPDKPKLAPVLKAGPAAVSFEEWPLPTKGSRPHDPLATPDGAIWYTGQFANKMGRVDPATGQVREYAIPMDGSGPHGLTVDADGDIWFTANAKGYVGRLDPETGKVTEYPVDARDPHTPIFDRRGTLWFTAQGANKVGRLDPATGKAELVELPTARSNPYGMVIDSKGTPFFVEFGGNRIGSLDPGTLALREWDLPDERARPRRVAIDEHDVLWYTDYARGYLGRFDTKSGDVREWPSPSGPESRPYGIAYTRGLVWYVETGTTPNALVRFDPKDGSMQSWAIPGGGGVVRNMMPTTDGARLVIAESAFNMIGRVTVIR